MAHPLDDLTERIEVGVAREIDRLRAEARYAERHLDDPVVGLAHEERLPLAVRQLLEECVDVREPVELVEALERTLNGLGHGALPHERRAVPLEQPRAFAPTAGRFVHCKTPLPAPPRPGTSP